MIVSRKMIGFAIAVVSFSENIASGTIASAKQPDCFYTCKTSECMTLCSCSTMSREEWQSGLYEYMSSKFPGFTGPTEQVMPCWWRYHEGRRWWNCTIDGVHPVVAECH